MMSKKIWLLYIFTVISLIVFVGFSLAACASLGDVFYIPATMPEGYGYLTIQNNDTRQDTDGNPKTGYGIREINVNGITDPSYSKS